jgi:hypothetical protein
MNNIWDIPLRAEITMNIWRLKLQVADSVKKKMGAPRNLRTLHGYVGPITLDLV